MSILGALCNFSMCLHLQFVLFSSSQFFFNPFWFILVSLSLSFLNKLLWKGFEMKKVSQWENLKTPLYFLYLSTHSPLTEARKMPSTTTTKYLDFKNFNPYFLSKLISMLNLVRPRYWPHTCDVAFCYLALSI